jgi:hypothetical protein
MAAVNPVAFARELIQVHAPLAWAEVRGNVFGHVQPLSSKTTPCITVDVGGGASEPNCALYNPLAMKVRVWSTQGGFATTRSVYGLVRVALHGLVAKQLTAGWLVSCVETGPAQDLTDFDSEWSSTLGWFALIMGAEV